MDRRDQAKIISVDVENDGIVATLDGDLVAAARARWTDGRVYVFYFLTHAQYQRGASKETL